MRYLENMQSGMAISEADIIPTYLPNESKMKVGRQPVEAKPARYVTFLDGDFDNPIQIY